MCGHAARVVLNEPPRCTAKWLARLSSSTAGIPAHLMFPALLMRMSTRPKRSRAASMSALAPVAEATSWLSASAPLPISPATSDAGSASRSLTTTRASRAASRRAYARPIPRPAPVTIATRPSKLYVKLSGDRRLEAQEIAERAAEHGGTLVGGNPGEERLDQLLAAPEGSLGVRVVGAPDKR